MRSRVVRLPRPTCPAVRRLWDPHGGEEAGPDPVGFALEVPESRVSISACTSWTLPAVASPASLSMTTARRWAGPRAKAIAERTRGRQRAPQESLVGRPGGRSHGGGHPGRAESGHSGPTGRQGVTRAEGGLRGPRVRKGEEPQAGLWRETSGSSTGPDRTKGGGGARARSGRERWG